MDTNTWVENLLKKSELAADEAAALVRRSSSHDGIAAKLDGLLRASERYQGLALLLLDEEKGRQL
jgi:hypothetical protein